MSLKKKTLKNLQFVGIAQILSLGFMQLAYLALAKILNPDDIGLYAAVLVVYNLAVGFSMLGLDQAAIQSKDDVDSVLRTGATYRMTAAIVAVGVILLAAPLISSFFKREEMTAPLRLMTLALLISSAGFFSLVKLSKELRFRELSISKVSNAVVWPVVAIGAAIIGLSYWSMILALVLGSAAALAVLWIYAPWKVVFRADRQVARKLLRFGKFPVAIGFVTFLFFNLDKVVIGRFLGTDLLGIYFLAFTWGTAVPTIFTNVVNNVMFPTYAKISDKREVLSMAYLKTITYLAYMSLPIGFGLAAVSKVFVASVLGPEWKDAAVPLALLSFVGLSSALTSPAGSLFLATGNPNLSWRQSSITFAVYAALLIPAVVYWGIVGVSILMLAIVIISLIWVLKMASGIVGGSLGQIGRSIWKPALAASSMGALTYAVSTLLPVNLLSLVELVALGVAFYALLIYALNRKVLKKEIESLVGALLSR